ncbi:MAG: N-6 DNA methylase, partial [Chloroflexi bacterium]|nr:N-6 DNA methylase [Chloroflexota bacterium]
MESPRLNALITTFPVLGNAEVVHPHYAPPQGGWPGRVYINKTQYLGVAPEIWEFMVGGYQVLDKWLKDRHGRALSFNDLLHYQKIVVALQETIRLMAEIDGAIEAPGGWPLR